jgi:creatinine amidohydrolase
MTRQLERLRPAQIRAAMADCPRIWLPLGTIEWHSEHLPVGLDGLQAHGLCLDAADIAGGLVYPPLYYGTGGGHGSYPWTVMLPDRVALRQMLTLTLTRLLDFGVAEAVLFTGHFADEQMELIGSIASDWNARHLPLRATALGVNGNAVGPIAPDHAGLFETTLLHSFHPALVDLTALPAARTAEAAEDPFGPQRHDPSHSLYGVFGPDPRGLNPETSSNLRKSMATWLAAQIKPL